MPDNISRKIRKNTDLRTRRQPLPENIGGIQRNALRFRKKIPAVYNFYADILAQRNAGIFRLDRNRCVPDRNARKRSVRQGHGAAVRRERVLRHDLLIRIIYLRREIELLSDGNFQLLAGSIQNRLFRIGAHIQLHRRARISRLHRDRCASDADCRKQSVLRNGCNAFVGTGIDQIPVVILIGHRFKGMLCESFNRHCFLRERHGRFAALIGTACKQRT